MALSTNISTLTTNLGAYFRKFKPEIISDMVLGLFDPQNPFNVLDRFTLMDGCTDEVPMPSLATADIVKPANDTTFAATSNALVWGSRTLKVRRWKADLQIVPGEYEKSWLGHYKTPGSLNEKKMVLEEFIVQEIIKRIQQNVRQAVIAGTYSAGGTAVNDIVDGLKTLLDAEVTATTITPTTLVAPTTSNVITQVEDVFDDLGDIYKSQPDLIVLLPTAWYNMYARANVNTLGRFSDFAADKMKVFGRPNATILEEPNLSGNRVIVTQKSNLVIGVDTESEYNDVRFQEYERTIKMMVDGKIGIQVKSIRDTNRPLAYGKD